MLFTILLIVGFLLGSAVIGLAIQYGKSTQSKKKAIYTIEWRCQNKDFDFVVTRTQIIAFNEIEAAEDFVSKIESGSISNEKQKITNWEILSIQKDFA